MLQCMNLHRLAIALIWSTTIGSLGPISMLTSLSPSTFQDRSRQASCSGEPHPQGSAAVHAWQHTMLSASLASSTPPLTMRPAEPSTLFTGLQRGSQQ
jgi:hypothetical protein